MITWNLAFLLRRCPPQELPESLLETALLTMSLRYRDLCRLGVPSPTQPIERRLRSLLAPSRILLTAERAATTICHSEALRFAKNHLPPDLRHTYYALSAHLAAQTGDWEKWCANINSYLSYFDLSPVQVKNRSDSHSDLFASLTSRKNLPSVDGPLVSILMPAYNEEHRIYCSVQSLLSQTWRNLEVIIVDDNSTDGTWRQIHRLATEDPRVKAIRSPVNVGPYVCKNIALGQAQGEWITCHDADDWAHPQRIASQWEHCVRVDRPACLSGMLRINEAGAFTQLRPHGSANYFDGVARVGFVTLFVEAQYMRERLGSWDDVRVSGDSEIIRRIERIDRKPISRLQTVSMFCLDSPHGLTRDSVLGAFGDEGMSSYRREYMESYMAAHQALSISALRYEPWRNTRPFAAPGRMLNSEPEKKSLARFLKEEGITSRRDIAADVAIVTNFRLAGGNMSSSLDEARFLQSEGLNVVLVHCPHERTVGKPLSDRIRPWRKHLVDWTQIETLRAKVIICRAPIVISCSPFRELSGRLEADTLFVVTNNSRYRASGKLVYDFALLVENVKRPKTRRVVFCPIGPLVRKELEGFRGSLEGKLEISERDWNPTFSVGDYYLPPKVDVRWPVTIGRHGRGSSEKWLEEKDQLLQAYPEEEGFRISILGGAEGALATLGRIPSNWHVYEFGEIEPKAYLRDLDVFVYFPASGLIEAFGRTVLEAIIAGRPVIVSKSLAPTFGELALYCEPKQVKQVVARIIDSPIHKRKAFLKEAQAIAIAAYGSDALAARLGGIVGLEVVSHQTFRSLSATARAFRRWLIADL